MGRARQRRGKSHKGRCLKPILLLFMSLAACTPPQDSGQTAGSETLTQTTRSKDTIKGSCWAFGFPLRDQFKPGKGGDALGNWVRSYRVEVEFDLTKQTAVPLHLDVWTLPVEGQGPRNRKAMRSQFALASSERSGSRSPACAFPHPQDTVERKKGALVLKQGPLTKLGNLINRGSLYSNFEARDGCNHSFAKVKLGLRVWKGDAASTAEARQGKLITETNLHESPETVSALAKALEEEGVKGPKPKDGKSPRIQITVFDSQKRHGREAAIAVGYCPIYNDREVETQKMNLVAPYVVTAESDWKLGGIPVEKSGRMATSVRFSDSYLTKTLGSGEPAAANELLKSIGDAEEAAAVFSEFREFLKTGRLGKCLFPLKEPQMISGPPGIEGSKPDICENTPIDASCGCYGEGSLCPPGGANLHAIGNFGACRGSGRRHAACDIYGTWQHRVYAISNGVTDSQDPDFYCSTGYVAISHDDCNGEPCVIRYGETHPPSTAHLSAGMPIKTGDVVGQVGLLDCYTQPMIHLERFSGAATGAFTDRSRWPQQRRSDLLNSHDLVWHLYKSCPHQEWRQK